VGDTETKHQSVELYNKGKIFTHRIQDMLNTKKILIISIIALVVLIVGMLLYNWLVQEKPETTPTTEEEGEAKLPEAEEREIPERKKEAEEVEEEIEGLEPLAEKQTIGAILDKTGKIKYFDPKEGNIWQAQPDGSGTAQLSLGAVGDLTEVLWSKDKDKALIAPYDSKTGGERFYSYDQATGKTWALDKHITAAIWHPEQDKIIYKYTDLEKRSGGIYVSDPDGTNYKEILSYAIKAELTPIPKKNKVSFYPIPSGYQESSINSIILDGGKPIHVIGGYYGLNILWSPEGNVAIISYTVYRAGTLTELALIGEGVYGIKRLETPTIVEKCVWSEDNITLFCAVPAPLRNDIVMPDDWYAGRVSTQDSFFKINTTTGEKIKLAGLEEFAVSYDVANLFLSEEEDKLFFTNRRDGKLYSIDTNIN